MSDHRDRAAIPQARSKYEERRVLLRGRAFLAHWTALTRVRVEPFLLAAMFTLGLFGFGGSGVLSRAVTWCKRITVLSAAPLSSTRSALSIQASQLYAPPAYEITSASMTQPSQLSPSSGWSPTLASIFMPPIWRGLSAGTLGSAPTVYMPTPGPRAGGGDGTAGVAGACAKITVWLPKASDPSKSPTVNDPNAKAILDIAPPPPGKAGNCSVLEYRYGEPPPQKVPRRKPRRIIRQTKIYGRDLIVQ